MQLGSIKEFLLRYKYPLVILVIGLLFLLFPADQSKNISAESEDILLQQVLACSKGVGEAMLISSENGVVISCEGANNAQVRLDIIRAVSSYTGFSSDKITILKMVK